MHVGAQDVRQDQGVSWGGLLARDGVPVAVPGRGQRVDRERLPVRRTATSSPRDVSIATGIGSSSVSPCSASRFSRILYPAASSVMCRLDSNWPLSSTKATSWVFSAQSIPQ
jgi:hypothetical protein